MGRRNKRYLICGLVAGLLLGSIYAWAASRGSVSTKFSSVYVPYYQSPGLQAAQDMYGIEGSSKTSWVRSMDAWAAAGPGVSDHGNLTGLADTDHSAYQPVDAQLTDLADGTLTGNFVNTAYPWADNEVADNITASGYQPLDATLTDLASAPLTEAESIGDAALPTTATFNAVTGTTVTVPTLLDVNGTIDAEGTVDFATTVVVNGQLHAVSTLNVDGTSDFAAQMDINADMHTDRYQGDVTNTLLGILAMGAGNLDKTGGDAGENNVAIGNRALYSIEEGYGNIAIGRNAMPFSDDGTRNVAIGDGTLGATGAVYDPDHNVAIGFNAGAATRGNGNVFVGSMNGDTLTSGSYNIFLGYDIVAPIGATTSDQLVIGRNQTANKTAILANSMGADLSLYGDVKIDDKFLLGSETTFAAADSTPSVAGGNMFAMAATGATIVDFDGGVAGQRITVRAVSSTTDVTDGGDLNLSGNFTGGAGDVIELYTPDGTNWYEVADTDTSSHLATAITDNLIVEADLAVSEKSSYGFMYAEDMTTTINTPDTYTQIASYAGTVMESGAGYVVAGSTAGTFTIGASGGGVYDIDAFMSFTASGSDTIHCAIHVDGTENSAMEFERQLGAGNDIGAAALGGLVTLTNTDVVDLMCKNNAQEDIVAFHLSFKINRIGP